ncbi:hypothetical protein Salat_0171500 [Sesamum alatum]|uniref:PB1 domain-containing protein n=1 Tax=Sesamum alatum TaxID=300844 RepID=A0AAE1YY22_9LAMI|nr:hypothetical protein Salat_0171500 [Sesamum alatum]
MSPDAAVISRRIVSSGSAPCSAPGSPRSRLKFLCSHGGKILPRPADGQLKYVGGETRVISVPRDIPFKELMTKLTYLVDGEMILKYQVLSEDLDALISVKSDEDLHHMFDEIDRYESAGSTRMRTFLFPVNPIMMENQMGSPEPHAIEQWYIDSINGIIRTSPFVKQHPTISTMQHGSLVSSACSSPRSPDSCTTEAINSEFMLHSRGMSMHKVHSSPNICGLNMPPQSNHHLHQLPLQYHPRQAHLPGHLSPKPRTDPYKNSAPERLISVRSVGRADGIRYQVDPGPQHIYGCRQNRGCTKCMHNDDCIHFSDRRIADRTGCSTVSPVPSSPRYGHGGIKPWDSMINGEMRAN